MGLTPQSVDISKESEPTRRASSAVKACVGMALKVARALDAAAAVAAAAAVTAAQRKYEKRLRCFELAACPIRRRPSRPLRYRTTVRYR
jgi:hypothetical protein